MSWALEVERAPENYSGTNIYMGADAGLEIVMIVEDMMNSVAAFLALLIVLVIVLRYSR